MPIDRRFVCERPDIFDKLQDIDWFLGFVEFQYRETVSGGSHLSPMISRYLLKETFSLWRKDLRRVSHMELNGSELDHFKQAAHLCYWLRRSSPISDFADHLPDGAALSDKQKDVRDLIFRYGNEFAAFDVGYRLCRFFEAKRDDVTAMLLMTGPTSEEQQKALSAITQFVLEEDYVKTICHFLKEKNVSPHALYLIYRSLFMDIRQRR